MSFNKYHVNRPAGDIETHEVFLDTLSRKKDEELGFSEKKLEVKIKEKFIYSMAVFFLLLAGFMFARSFWLQVVDGKQYYALSQANKGRVNIIIPERGIIYDKNLQKLVLNAPAYDLVCDKTSLIQKENAEQQIATIAGIVKQESSAIETLVTESNQPKVLIASDIDQSVLLVLEAKKNDIPDCRIEKNTTRNYLFGSSFSHVLGHMGKISKNEFNQALNYAVNDNIGKDGLEKQYESYLRGTPGQSEIIKTAQGVYKGDTILSEPSQGHNLVLNIDANLQKLSYEALERSIKNIGAKRGAAVALDPRSGAVLAMVSYPSYDNNIFSKSISQKDFDALNLDPNQPFFNRAVGAKYPVGSTIKPFLASGALEEGIIDPAKKIYDPGYIIVRSQYDPSVTYKFAGVKPHGWVDMREALAVSSNIYFFTVGGGYEGQEGLGPTRIKKYLDMYGWEQKTGIDLPGEFKGFVPTAEWKKQTKNEPWWDGDTYNLSIGQSDLQVTPLQVAVGYAAIANGGTLYKPQIVQKIIDTSSGKPETIQEFAPEIAGTVNINQEYLQIIREGMREGVRRDYGSSVMLNDLPVAVAGKTGTAETNKAGIFNTWSSNFAPYDNPEIVFVTTIEGVPGLRSATLPVAHEVLQYYFAENRK